MKKGLIAGTAAVLIVSGPVFADGGCPELCNASFYATATAADVQQLLTQGIDVNAQDEVGKTALHWAATAKPKVTSALLAAGADVNARDKWDRTPLHFVGANGSVENIRLLLDAGAEVNAKTANDWTPLHGAAKFGGPDNVMILLNAGADPFARTEMGESAYDFGASNPKLAGSDVLKTLEDAQ